MLGTCLHFDRMKGYGFLVSADDPLLPDIFVHFSDVEQSPVWNRRFLLPGMKVQFDVEPDPSDPENRFRARHIRVVGPINIARQVSDGNKVPS